MAFQCDTFKYDAPSGEPISWFLAFTYQDDGVEMLGKIIRKLRAKGKFTNASMQVYGVTPDATIDIDDLTTGANPIIDISLDDSTEITQYAINKVRCRNLLMYTVRIAGTGTFDGTGLRDTFEEIAILTDTASQER